MRDIYIVRHGNTFDKGDTVTRVGARTDLPLSVSGNEQAVALAAHFAKRVSGFDKVYCSPLKRTQETAASILASQSFDDYEVEALEFLREIDYGPDENKPEDDVVARIGEDALRAWEEKAVPPKGWIVDPTELIQAWKDLFDRISKLPASKNPILIVTSNGVARFALQAIEASEGHTLKLKTGAYGVVRISKTGPSIVEWNTRP
ncbi:histidine phosphatase family protein [Hirschia maritima]|uniref:histidine phosphatase family protein n=1 Tax=Hirschia maritima TaxID=1121961 RepID=UPI0003AA632B|nr:histidine phosphatase family protein [Hirschia maritima]